MKIAVDARTYFLRSGTGRYTRGIVDSLIKGTGEDEFFVLLSNHKRPEDFPANGPHLKLKVSAASLNDPVAERTILPREIADSRSDAAFFPFFITPPGMCIPAAASILDLTVLRHECGHRQETVQYISSWLSETVTRADRIVAISNFVRSEILTFAGNSRIRLEPGRVVTIYPGVDEAFRPQATDEDEERLWKLGLRTDGYLLYVGSIEARKNADHLVRSFDRITLDVGIPLVMAGLERWGTGAFRQALDEMQHRDRVWMLGFVDEEVLPALYRSARVVVYPSLSEGFGFPVVEAYACGTPVVTSNTSSLDEIGDAAIRVDPTDVEQLEQALLRVCLDQELRRQLMSSGLRRAEDFSWSRCSNALRALLHGLASNAT